MRVVIAQKLRPFPALRAMGVDQRLRVDLEMALGRQRDIAGALRLGDHALASQQQTTGLFGRGQRGMLLDRFYGRVGKFNMHGPRVTGPRPKITPRKCGNPLTGRLQAAMLLPVADNLPKLRSMGDSEVIRGTLPDAGGRLDKALAEASGLSRERVKALIGEGRITLDGRAIKSPSGKAPPGARFEIVVPPAADAEAQAQDIPLSVTYEDEHLIVIDKPAGMVVHPAAGNHDGTLVNALLHHCRGQLSGIGGVARPGIVHRIDKDTSGLLVVAKSDTAHEGLARQFADHSIERAYLAVVGGHPQPLSGTISARIGRSDANRKKMAVIPDTSSRGKHAVTHYKTLTILQNSAIVQCRLETGRTHQVRVHMASIGHALLGDPAYGRTSSKLRPILAELQFQRQALHAAELGFIHPVNCNRLHFRSELPSDMRSLIDQLH